MTVTRLRSDRSAEAAVALTDLALGVEAGVFAVLLARQRAGKFSPVRGPLVVLTVRSGSQS